MGCAAGELGGGAGAGAGAGAGWRGAASVVGPGEMDGEGGQVGVLRG